MNGALAEPADADAPSTENTVAISVIVPTYHRPERLRACVGALSDQEVSGHPVEILVCLSDPLHQADRRAAARLAEADQRIRIVEAQAPGPAAARNAGIRIARGDRLAFIDDDCVPQPGWLAAGVTALENVDLVQGHTWSAEALSVMPFGYHSVWCDSLSLLWESCNLFVRRSAIERAGPFDEEYNPTRQAHGHWGEDAEWGWRLIRNGARYVFAPDARVAHAVTPRSIHALIEYKSRTRYLPGMLTEIPELRQRLYHRYFLNRRHIVMTATTALVVVACMTRLGGARRAAWVAALAGMAGWAAPLPGEARTHGFGVARHVARRTISETAEFAGCLYGSTKHRRIVL